MTDTHAAEPDLFTAAAPKIEPMPDGVPPDVCHLFEKVALEAHDAGLKRYSARAILHRLRWFYHVENGDAEFRINNKHSAPLARRFIARHPDMADFFELRESTDR